MRTSNAHMASVRIAMVIALAATLLGGVPHATAGDAAAQPADSTGAGMRVYRDPATGEFTAPPPGAELPPVAHAPGGPSEPTLLETPGTSPAGGVTIDLRGAFQSSITATANESGVRTDCHTDASGATSP